MQLSPDPNEMPKIPIEAPDHSNIPEITPAIGPDTTPIPEEEPTVIPVEEPTETEVPDEMPPTTP